MAIKLPPVDFLGVNMTPMIDIVFNLVQFFMLSLDLSHKELAVLDLPVANQGIEDKDPATNPHAKPGDKFRFIINIQADGSLYVKGETFKLFGATAEAQDLALDKLRSQLRTWVRDVPREAEGNASMGMVLVRGDRSAKWRYVQWIMQVCSDPQIRIYKLHFAVEHPRKDAPKSED